MGNLKSSLMVSTNLAIHKCFSEPQDYNIGPKRILLANVVQRRSRDSLVCELLDWGLLGSGFRL